MKKVILYSVTIFITMSVHGQSWQWAKRGGSAENPDTADKEKVISMCVDPKGNVTVASQIGSYLIDIDGVPKAGYSVLDISSDVAIASFSCNGAYRWSKTIGGFETDYIQDVGTDAQGNVYAVGKITAGLTDLGTSTTAYQAHFDTDTILPAASQSVNQYKKSLFLIKYDSIGTFKWLRMPQPDNVSFTATISQYSSQNLQVDAAGNCYWMVRLPAGTHAGGNYVVTGAGVTQHILKYDTQGNFINGHPINFNAQGTSTYRMIRNHQNGNYYIAGKYYNTTGEIYTIGGQVLTKSLFVAAFDSTGAFLWTRTNNGVDAWGNPDNYDVAVDANNDVYFTGSTLLSNAIDDPNFVIDGWNGQQFTAPPTLLGAFMFVVKMDSLGNTIWQTNSNQGQANAITIKGDEVAITGASWSFIWQNLNFVYPNNGQGGQTPFIIRFNKTTGALIGHSYLLSPSVTWSTGTRILADNLGNYLVGGDVAYQLTGFGNTITNVGGSSDFFVAKWGTASCNFLGTSNFEQKKIKLYPNPVKNQLSIDSNETQNYAIYSILGSKVKEGSLTVGSTINCSELTAGVYIIRLIDALGIERSLKFVKE